MWRAISDALPSRLNLMKRKVLNEATCQVCGLEPESSMHALWLCPNLAVVWDAHFGTLRNETKDCTNLLDVFRVGLENGHPSDLVGMVTSLIWQRRNKLRIGEPVADLRLLYSTAREALQEFQHAHTPASHSAPTRIHSKWEPPPSDWVKINFDGAVFQSKGEAGLGAIIRNDHGLVMAALTQVIPLPTSVETVEVLAARRALYFAQELGFDHIILEGDSDIAIRAMKEDSFSAASFGHILADIKVLSSNFRHLVFNHTRKRGNKVAHSLARAACNFFPICTWIEDVPEASVVVYLSEILMEA
nr:uncharacterized protein LOC111991659 [Quercus suber]